MTLKEKVKAFGISHNKLQTDKSDVAFTSEQPLTPGTNKSSLKSEMSDESGQENTSYNLSLEDW